MVSPRRANSVRIFRALATISRRFPMMISFTCVASPYDSTPSPRLEQTKLKPKWDVHFALTFAATCPIHTWDMEEFRCGLLVPQL